MRKFLKIAPAILFSVMLVVATIAPITGATSAGRLTCYQDWSEASLIVDKENLAVVAEVSEAARSAENAQVVRTVLCRVANAYVYRVVLKDQTGRLRTETVNARRPFGVAAKAK